MTRPKATLSVLDTPFENVPFGIGTRNQSLRPRERISAAAVRVHGDVADEDRVEVAALRCLGQQVVQLERAMGTVCCYK